MEVTIRPMEKEDRESVIGMMRVFYASDAVLGEYDDSVFERDFDDCTGACPFVEGYVFEVCGETAGYSMEAMSYSTEEGGLCLWVEDLYVRPGYRGKGISSQFFSFLEREYGDRVRRIRLEVEADNMTARRVYDREGYEILPYEQRKKSL